MYLVVHDFFIKLHAGKYELNIFHGGKKYDMLSGDISTGHMDGLVITGRPRSWGYIIIISYILSYIILIKYFIYI